MSSVDLLYALVTITTCMRLIMYQRGHSVFKVIYSIIAYVLIVGYGSIALALLTGLFSSNQVHAGLVLLTTMLSISLFYCHGNVSLLIKLAWRIKHDFDFR